MIGRAVSGPLARYLLVHNPPFALLTSLNKSFMR